MVVAVNAETRPGDRFGEVWNRLGGRMGHTGIVQSRDGDAVVVNIEGGITGTLVGTDLVPGMRLELQAESVEEFMWREQSRRFRESKDAPARKPVDWDAMSTEDTLLALATAPRMVEFCQLGRTGSDRKYGYYPVSDSAEMSHLATIREHYRDGRPDDADWHMSSPINASGISSSLSAARAECERRIVEMGYRIIGPNPCDG